MELFCRHFSELSKGELYSILRLRAEVFVVEQHCPYQDLDGNDSHAFHIFAKEGDDVVACLRVYMKDSERATIGRVVASQGVRGTGLAKTLMVMAKELVEREYGKRPIVIHAQCYAIGFYEKCGFKVTSDTFLEDDIPHVEMTLFPEWEIYSEKNG